MKKAGENLPAVQLELMPAQMVEARQMLERTKSIGEVKGIRDRASLFRAYAIQARDRAMENRATEIRMWAERRAGQMLLETKAKEGLHKGGRPNAKPVVDDDRFFQVTLKELYISKDESSQWQRLAVIPEDEFEDRLKTLREIGARYSTNSFLQTAFSSESVEHLSPKDIILAAIEVMGEIDLDPCAEAKGARANVPARDHYTQKDDGLSKPWRGRVYMNPPYGNQVELFSRRLLAGVQSGEVPEAIALLAARTDTAWFQLFGDAPVCFVTGRLKFGDAENGAPFPSAIFYLGTVHRSAFAKRFSEFGPIYARVREFAHAANNGVHEANRSLSNG